MRTLTGLTAGETIDYVVGGRGEFALNLGDPYVAGSGGVGGGGNGGLGAIGMGGGGGGASYVSGASIAGVFAAGGGGGGSHGRYGYAGHGQGGQASGAGGAGGAGSDGHSNSGSYGGGGGGGGGAGIPGGLGGAGGVGASNTIPPGSDGAAGDAGGSIAGVTACAGTAYSGQSGSPGSGGESGGAHVLPAPSGIPGRGGNSDVEYFHPAFLSGAGLVRFTFDTTAPETTITASPAALAADGNAMFTFTGTDDFQVTGYECSLDGAAFAACTSPQSYAGLALGTHTFAVRAADIAGHVDPTPATYSWLFDVAAPDTTITDAPLSGTPNTHASFSFTGTDDVAVVGYECSLDGAPFSACTSPMTYAGLAAAPHVFEVRAVDGAGQVDPTPASYAWSVTKPAQIPTLSQWGLILMSLMAGAMGMLMAYRRSWTAALVKRD